MPGLLSLHAIRMCLCCPFPNIASTLDKKIIFRFFRLVFDGMCFYNAYTFAGLIINRRHASRLAFFQHGLLVTINQREFPGMHKDSGSAVGFFFFAF